MDKTVCERGGRRRRHPGRSVARGRRLRPQRRADRADPRPARARGRRARGRLEQLRRRRLGPRAAARGGPHPQGDRLVHRREQGVRAAVPRRRGRGRADAAGHARRAAARGRRRHPRLLHAGGRRNGGLRRRDAAALRRGRLGRDGQRARRSCDRSTPSAGRATTCSSRPSAPTSGSCAPRSATGTATCGSRSRPATSTRSPGMAGRITIAEVDELVEPGELGPDDIHLPGIYVDRIVALTPEQANDLPIEKVTVGRARRTHPTRTEPSDAPHPRRAGRPCRRRARGRHVCQPRHRTADADPQPPARRHPRRPAFRERHPRRRPVPVGGRGGPEAHQRGQGDGHRAARRELLRLGRELRHDPRRPRRDRRARRDAGLGRAATSPTGRCPARWSRAWAARWTSSTAPSASSWSWSTSPRTARRRSSRSATCRSPGGRCVDRIITDLAVFDVTDDGLVLRELVAGRHASSRCGPRPGRRSTVDPALRSSHDRAARGRDLLAAAHPGRTDGRRARPAVGPASSRPPCCARSSSASKVAPDAVDRLIMAQCYPTMEAPALGRVAALDAGLPVDHHRLPARRALRLGAAGGAQRRDGGADRHHRRWRSPVGVESMSNAPLYTEQGRRGIPDGGLLAARRARPRPPDGRRSATTRRPTATSAPRRPCGASTGSRARRRMSSRFARTGSPSPRRSRARSTRSSCPSRCRDGRGSVARRSRRAPACGHLARGARRRCDRCWWARIPSRRSRPATRAGRTTRPPRAS